MIVAAAIKTSDGKLWVAGKGLRHDTCFKVIAEGISYRIEVPYESETEAERERWLDYVRDHVQGFTTDQGVFLDREESYEHAKAVGQLGPDVQGVRVANHVYGKGRVIDVMRVPAHGCRIQVQFEGEPCWTRWCGVEDLERLLLGGVLTSEDLW